MPSDSDNNRSSALSPEAIAAINVATQAAVQSALLTLKPVFDAVALTPEKLTLLRTPIKTDKELALEARERRESIMTKADSEDMRRMEAARKANCVHLDKNGRSSICLVHNQPDHQPRGVCVSCHDWIHPKEWRFTAPDAEHPRGVPVLVPAHKDYKIVMGLESYV
jgi:hypothetical protein